MIKKFIATLLLLGLMSLPANAAGPVRVEGSDGKIAFETDTSIAVNSDDASIKAKEGRVHQVIISWDGATAGDDVHIVNKTTPAGALDADIILAFTAIATDSQIIYTPTTPIKFSAGISILVTSSGGTVTVTIIYDWQDKKMGIDFSVPIFTATISSTLST